MAAGRANSFDVLRLYAAILVLWGHSYPLTGFTSPGFAGNPVATIGVKIFFIISGYLVTKSWLSDPHIVRFATRRAIRIWPALIALTFVSIVCGSVLSVLPASEYFRSPVTHSYLSNLVFFINYYLPGVFEHNPYPGAINGSLWSLPAEISMYILVPVFLPAFVRARGRLLSWWIVILAILFCIAALFGLGISRRLATVVVYGTDASSWLEVAPYFVLGAVFAANRLEQLLDPGIALLGLLCLCVFSFPEPWQEAVVLLALPYITLSFGLYWSPLTARLQPKSDLSYGIYLYAFPVQQLVAHFAGRAHGPLGNFVLALGPTVLLAAASWHLVERPMLLLKPSRRGAPQSAEARAAVAVAGRP